MKIEVLPVIDNLVIHMSQLRVARHLAELYLRLLHSPLPCVLALNYQVENESVSPEGDAFNLLFSFCAGSQSFFQEIHPLFWISHLKFRGAAHIYDAVLPATLFPKRKHLLLYRKPTLGICCLGFIEKISKSLRLKVKARTKDLVLLVGIELAELFYLGKYLYEASRDDP